MDFLKKRWISLVAAMICAVFIGIIYSWSVYVKPLADKYGWSIAETSIAYTINFVFTSLAPILTGKLRARFKLSHYCLIGTLLYSGGIIMCGFIQSSVLEVYLYFGVLTGSGIGLIYLSLAPYVVQLFPDRRGMAAGFYTACYGLAAFFWAPAAQYIMSNFGDVSTAFIYIGVIMGVGLLLVIRFLYEVPAGWQGGGRRSQSPANSIHPLHEKSPKELLGMPLYYIVLIMYTCGYISGMMVVSLGSPIIVQSLNFTPTEAAIVVGLFAAASTGGRLFWGFISDFLGRFNVLIILGAITCLSMIILANTTIEYVFLACLLAVPMCYGAYAATMPPTTVETFGARHLSMNFSMVFISFALAALIGPQIAAYIQSSSGSYQQAFFYATIFAGMAVGLGVIFKYIIKKQKKALENAG